MSILILINVLAILILGLAAKSYTSQLKQGLSSTGLGDTHSWGLYIQGFFFLGATAGGLSMSLGMASLLGQQPDHLALALILGCLAGGGGLLIADLGKPWRSLLMGLRPNLKSPIFWDFICFSLTALLSLVGLLGLSESWPRMWGLLCLALGLAFLCTHVHFLLIKQAKTSPFLSLNLILESLWSATGLLVLTSLFTVNNYNNHYTAWLILSTTMMLIQNLANPKDKRQLLKYVVPNILVLALCLLSWTTPQTWLLGLAALGACTSVFLNKGHKLQETQSTVLPPPFNRFEKFPNYKISPSEILITAGGFSLAILITTLFSSL